MNQCELYIKILSTFGESKAQPLNFLSSYFATSLGRRLCTDMGTLVVKRDNNNNQEAARTRGDDDGKKWFMV